MDGRMERWTEREREKRRVEKREADFRVLLTGRPEGQTVSRAQSQRCVFVRVERMAWAKNL